MTDRAIIVGVRRPRMSRTEALASLEELVELVRTAGGVVAGRLFQEVKAIHPATLIGVGKVHDLSEQVRGTNADVVIIDDELTPVQNRNLERALEVRVLDRTALILDVFALRARTEEGKLQVEAAQLAYLAPRLVGRGKTFSQQVGRIGTRGPGETALEYSRRRLRERQVVLNRRLEQVRRERKVHRAQRENVPLPLVALVGYTNAGKSTLMNALTKAGVFVEDTLFATLDPTVRRLRLPSGRMVLLADTVGFIRRLPHQLVKAFRATFEEIAYAHLIAHIVDVADEDAEHHVATVETVLGELELNHKPRLTIHNKSDRQPHHLRRNPEAIPISALTGEGINHLLERLDEALRVGFLRVRLRLPYNRGDILSEIYRVGHVWKAKHLAKTISVDCELPEKFVGKWKRFL
ncbi:MAG: GTPase HflX [Deltaproteobacteria bacterium]|nr:GTPase HflX [Deltaproteobacteria bacterium]